MIDLAQRRGHGGIDDGDIDDEGDQDEGDRDEDGDEGTGVPVGVS